MTVLEPRNVPALAAMLATANRERVALVPRGGGTRVDRGARLSGGETTLSLAGLPRDIEHCSGDLTATVSASATIGEVNAQLARAGQWLPLDPVFTDRSTIGGLIATNACGPARHRYGAPRDLIIGVDLALADGRTAKAGGRVVKNVAGYDLARLVCGSFGSLAVITRATFKLVPLPPTAITVEVTWPGEASEGTHRLAEAALALAAQPLTPTAVELDVPSPRLLLRFESTPAGADRQASAAAAFCVAAGLRAARIGEDRQSTVWRDRAASTWNAARTVVRVSVLPTDVIAMLEAVAVAARDRGISWHASGHIVLGVFYIALDGLDEAQAAVITAVRQTVETRRGHAVVLAAGAGVKRLVDPWGDPGNAFRLMQAVKARFDPHGILNPGNGPGGL
jgi:glycolate oxidase FAD binding subunit